MLNKTDALLVIFMQILPSGYFLGEIKYESMKEHEYFFKFVLMSSINCVVNLKIQN